MQTATTAQHRATEELMPGRESAPLGKEVRFTASIWGIGICALNLKPEHIPGGMKSGDRTVMLRRLPTGKFILTRGGPRKVSATGRDDCLVYRLGVQETREWGISNRTVRATEIIGTLSDDGLRFWLPPEFFESHEDEPETLPAVIPQEQVVKRLKDRAETPPDPLPIDIVTISRLLAEANDSLSQIPDGVSLRIDDSGQVRADITL